MVLAAAVASNAAGAQQLRDPTRPPALLGPSKGESGAGERRAGLSLQSILIAPDRRSAIIDGRLLNVGESVSGFRVVAIEEGAVTLRGSAGLRRLELFPEVVKRPGRMPGEAESPDATRATETGAQREEG